MTMGPGERQLLAMLNGDVAGYGRLMATDEEATIRMLAAHRDGIAVAVVANHGRLVDFTGDNFLAEFGIALHALSCAVEIQHAIHAKNADIPHERRMNFRLGAHVGDVLIDGDRIYGNAVIIASRLESLAEVGGICLSQQMLDQTTDQIDFAYEDLGEQTLKNIPDPVRAYRIPTKSLIAAPPVRHEGGRSRVHDSTASQGIPTIAVLPFADLSADPDQENLVDAMTVDIITGLSCDRRFSVIAYNSVMQFKGNVPDIKDVGKILGARYVVEGTVRQIGPRMRVSTALIDVESRRELWGERLDRELTDIFGVFDELVEAIVTALASHLRMAEGERYRRKPPEQLDAWALAIQASEIFFLNPTKTLDDSLSLARRALEIDPQYPYAWAVLGFLTAFKFPLGLSEDHQADIDESLRLTDRALALDARDPWNLVAKSVALQYGGRPAESMEYLQRSLRLNPSDVLTHCYYGRGLMFAGKPAIALAHFERFKRLNPNDPGAHMAGMYHCIALAFLQRWEEAEETARGSLAASGGRNPWSLVFLMVSLAAQGKADDAAAVIPELKRIVPHWDRNFVESFLTECQEDKELLPPIFEILRSVWPDGVTREL
jgi:adenylate cyclase